jgi:hypothetical protein
MCLMVYLATSYELPLRAAPEFCVEDVEESRQAVRQWFTLPAVRFVGAHTGCSCGFPHVIAEEPISYYDGMFSDTDREADLSSVRALLNLIRDNVSVSSEVQAYPVWDGEEGVPPKGTIELQLDDLKPETFFFNQGFFYRVFRNANQESS